MEAKGIKLKKKPDSVCILGRVPLICHCIYNSNTIKDFYSYQTTKYVLLLYIMKFKINL